MVRQGLLLILLIAVAVAPTSWRGQPVRVGSKKFTESVLLGEAVTLLLQSTGRQPLHFRELGGTKLVFEALRNGDIDIYPEYTGTIRQEILAGEKVADVAAMRQRLAQMGVVASEPLGFNNNYALGMVRQRAEELGIRKISDLARLPRLRLGFSSEFLDRQDGWPGLKAHYKLPHQNVRGLDHDVAYRQLEAGVLDVIDVYTTDANIEALDLAVLQDDRRYFPRYDAVLLYRADLAKRHPAALEAALRLTGTLDEATMRRLNAAVMIDRQTETGAAAEFLDQHLGVRVEVEEPTAAGRIVQHTREHLDLVRKSLVPAIVVAIPLGVWAAKQPLAGQVILASVGVVQTIPSLALLVMLIGPVNALGLSTVGSGSLTAAVALFLYSLLPIVRNTYAGIHDIPPPYRESAVALGLSATARMRLIELPLASRTILAGIKTAAVLNVGFATLGALIGAGGYGQPILTGIRLNNTALILQGAIPAAVLALLVQGLFGLAERWLVPKGLRLSGGR